MAERTLNRIVGGAYDAATYRGSVERDRMSDLKFGWIAPVIGPPESGHEPIVMYQAEHILPTASDKLEQSPNERVIARWCTSTMAEDLPSIVRAVLDEIWDDSLEALSQQAEATASSPREGRCRSA